MLLIACSLKKIHFRVFLARPSLFFISTRLALLNILLSEVMQTQNLEVGRERGRGGRGGEEDWG